MLGPLVARPRKRTGRPPVDNRRVLNGVLYVLNTGCAWMDNHRRLLIRFERKLANYRGFCLLALILWCLRRLLK